jgi:hypothetical protein
MANMFRAETRRGQPALIAALLLFGCGEVSFKNTPQQELALGRWDACESRVSGVQLNRVSLDGRILFWFDGPGERQSMLDCLRLAAKDGPGLPEPIADPRPGGGGGGGGM